MAPISFARGIPAPELLPVEEIGACAEAILGRDGRAILNYGPAAGYGPLREWIAERHCVSPGRVIVTNGSLQGFNLVARHLLAGGGSVLLEAPTYDRTLATLRTVGSDVTAIPLGDDGLDTNALAGALNRGRPRLVYTIPTFQNPTGRTLSLESRRALVELAAVSDALVYEDDPYRLVRFEGEPLPSLHELAGGERIVLSSSFSKIVAPGIRVGYLVVPEQLVAPIEALALETYLSPTIFVQGVVFEFLRTGRLDAHLERVRAGLRARRDAMLAALERELPESSSWNAPEGGYFLWLDLPPGVSATELLARATEAGVTFVKGADFYVDAGGEEAARLAFSFASVEEIDEGVALIGRLVRETAAVPA